MHLKKIVAFIILGLVAAHLEAVPTSKLQEEQRLEEEILKADHETLGNERSKKSVLLLNNQLPTITSSQTLGLHPSSQTVETLIQPNSQIVNVQSAPRTLETVNLLPNGQPLVNIQSLPQTVETVSIQQQQQPVQTISVQPNAQSLVNIQSVPQTVETVNLLPNGQQLVNIQSLPQTVETVSVQQPVQTISLQPNAQPLVNIQSVPQTVETVNLLPNAQPAQLLNIQSAPRTVETVSVQQPVQTVNLLPNAQLNIQSLPQTVETVSIQQQQQPVQTISVQPNAQLNIQSLPQTVETVSIQKPQLQALNLKQAGGQTLSVFPAQSTVIAQPPLPAQTNVNTFVPQQSPSVSVKEVQVESVALSSPSSVVERITQGFVNPLAGDEKVIVSPSLNELSLKVPASGEQVLVSPSTSFFTMVKPVETTSYVNVPQVYYNPRSLTSSRLVSRVL